MWQMMKVQHEPLPAINLHTSPAEARASEVCVCGSVQRAVRCGAWDEKYDVARPTPS